MLDPLFEGLTYAGSFGAIWLVLALVSSGFSGGGPRLVARVAATSSLAEMVSGRLKHGSTATGRRVANPEPEPLVPLPPTPRSRRATRRRASPARPCSRSRSRGSRRPLFVLAALIAFSRVYVGVHYPLDVLAGAVARRRLGFVVRSAGIAIRRLARRVAAG